MDFTSESKGFLINLVAKLLQIDPKELSDQLGEVETAEDIETTLSNVAADRIKHIRKNAKDMAYGRAKREEREAAEKLIKAKLGIETSGTLDELLETYTQKGLEEKPSKKTNLTLDDMLKSEAMRDHIGKFRKQIEELTSAVESEKQARQSDKLNWTVKHKANALLQSLGADFGDAETSKKRLKMFELALMQNQFKMDENDIYPVDANGDRVYGSNQYDPQTFEDVIKANWLFGFKDQKQNSNNTRTPNPNENTFNKTQFGLKEDDLKNGKLLYEKLQEAKKANNKEAVDYYKKQLLDSAK